MSTLEKNSSLGLTSKFTLTREFIVPDWERTGDSVALTFETCCGVPSGVAAGAAATCAGLLCCCLRTKRSSSCSMRANPCWGIPPRASANKPSLTTSEISSGGNVPRIGETMAGLALGCPGAGGGASLEPTVDEFAGGAWGRFEMRSEISGISLWVQSAEYRHGQQFIACCFGCESQFYL